MAKKAKGKNAVRRSAKRVQAKLPAGFTAIAVGGGFGAWWDQYKQKTLTGKVVDVDSYMTENDDGKKIKRRILRVDQGNGVTVNVGESFSLKALFDFPKIKGRTIFIQYLGQKSFKNKKGKLRKVNEYAAAVK